MLATAGHVKTPNLYGYLTSDWPTHYLRSRTVLQKATRIVTIVMAGTLILAIIAHGDTKRHAHYVHTGAMENVCRGDT